MSQRNHSTPLVRTAAILGLGLAATLSLTGCTLDFLPDQAPNPTESGSATDSSTDSGNSDDTATQTPAPGQQTEDTDVDGDDDNSGVDDRRDRYEDQVQRQLNCSGGTLDIADAGSVVEVDEDCTNVTVSGSGTVVLADDIKKLTVTGMDVTVFVDTLGAVKVIGSDNRVFWDDGNPKITNTGMNNTVEQHD